MTESEILASTLQNLLHDDFGASPTAASGLGLTDYDDRLDDLSADAFLARDAYARNFLARLDDIGDNGLTQDETIDRDLARSVLRGRLILAPFEGWKRDPYVYTGPVTGGLFTLFLQRLTGEGDRVEASVARLDQAASVVDAGIANLDPTLAHPLIVERGLNAARSSVRYVRDLVWRDVEDPVLRERLKAAGETATPTSSAGSATSKASSLAPRVRGSLARRATPGSCASVRSWVTTRARSVNAAWRSSTAWTPRCGRCLRMRRATPITWR